MRDLFRSLFWWCAFVFVAAGGLLLVAWNLWGASWSWFGGLGEEPVARATSALTTVGGLGGAVFLTVKYRERSSDERNETDERLSGAVSQLGSSSPQVRIAGVYALEALAFGKYKQRVVNILCGYLRTQSDNDGAVETSILQVVSAHFERYSSKKKRSIIPKSQLWSDCIFDLRSATLTEPVDFRGITLKSAHFEGATLNFVDFKDATLTDAHFEGATFPSAAFDEDSINIGRFNGATLNVVCFTDTEFEVANFEGAILNSVDFERLRFSVALFKNAIFDAVTFNDTYFIEAYFTDARCDAVLFKGAFFEHAYLPDAVLKSSDFTDSRFDIAGSTDLPSGVASLPEGAIWWNREKGCEAHLGER